MSKSLREFQNTASHLAEATMKAAMDKYKADNHTLSTVFDDGDGKVERNIVALAKILVPLAGVSAAKVKTDPKAFKTVYDVLGKLQKDSGGDLWLGNFISETPEVWKVLDATLKSGGVTVAWATVKAMEDMYYWASESTDASWMPRLTDKKLKQYMKAFKGGYSPEFGEDEDMDEAVSEAAKSPAAQAEAKAMLHLAMARIYYGVSKDIRLYSRGGNWDRLGYMAAEPEDLTPAAMKELEAHAAAFERLGDKHDKALEQAERANR